MTESAVHTTIITPCGDQAGDLREALASVEARTSLDGVEWLVVENGSGERASADIRQLCQSRPWLRRVPVAGRPGFGGACDAAARQAAGRHLVFLGPRTRVSEGWLDALRQLACRRPDAGAVGARLVGADGRVRHAGGVVCRDSSAWSVGSGDDPTDPEYRYDREVDWCAGAALLVTREAFQRAGGFDAGLPDAAAPIDLAFALRAAGYAVLCCGHAQVTQLDGEGPFDGWRPGCRAGDPDGLAQIRARWAREIAKQPPEPASLAEARHVADRRARYGRQVLMTAEELPQFDRNAGAWTFYRFMTLLLGAGHHVTFAARNTTWRWPDVSLAPYARKYQEAGCLLAGLDATWQGGRLLPPDAAFASILRRRRYDAALLWGARDGRWFLERIQQFSPWTRTAINTGDLQCLREGRALALDPPLVSPRVAR